MIQQELFGDSAIIQQNPLTDRRVGFIGKFKNRAALVRKVIEFGASPKSKDGLTRDTQILVMGSDIKQEVLNRLLCYEHDGWKPLKISENELVGIFKGHFNGYETPAVPTKQISIDMSYYNWVPPVLPMKMMTKRKVQAFVAHPRLSMVMIIPYMVWKFMFPTGLTLIWG